MGQYTAITSGFYHDIQKSNRLLKVTLHANSKPGGGEDGWDRGTEYYKEALVTSIVKEDFQVGISNSWGEFSMGETIQSLWNSLKPFAPYLGYASEKLGKMDRDGKELQGEGKLKHTLSNFAVDLIDKAKPYVDMGAPYLSRALVVEGTRFSYYAGTGVAFGNLGMKFTIFADWIDGKFVTVNEQLEKLYPYIVGKYIKPDSGILEGTLIDEFYGWQVPPGGFIPDLKNLDNVQKGTLMLKIGAFYCLKNLVVKDVQLNFSKHLVKHPTKELDISPLYCDVDLILTPASKYSDESLTEFVSGKAMETDKKEVVTDMTDRLSDEIANNKALSDSYNTTKENVKVDYSSNSALKKGDWI